MFTKNVVSFEQRGPDLSDETDQDYLGCFGGKLYLPYSQINETNG